VKLSRDDGFRLIIEDDGTGVPSSRPDSRGFGLASMRERAQALGGTMRVMPAAKHGARIEVWLP
jgi:signal transduction histidine kinase